jgi:predicted Zn-dependent peptidase
VYSSVSSYADTGTFSVYAGCTPAKTDEVLRLVREELASVADSGLTDAEVKRAKGALRGALVLDLEDTGARMSRIGKAELLSDELLTPDELLDRLAAVTPDDVRAVAADVLTRPLALGAIGPLGDTDLSGAVA